MQFNYTNELREFTQLLILSMSLSVVVMYLTELIKKSITTENTKIFTIICLVISMSFGIFWALSFTSLSLNYSIWLGILTFLGSSGFYKTLEDSESWLGKTVKSYSDYINGNELAEEISKELFNYNEAGEMTGANIDDDTQPNISKAEAGLEPGYVSKNFRKSEFACKCGGEYCDNYANLGENPIDTRLVEVLQRARDYYGKPIIITSGIRCRKHNSKVGGVEGSRHTSGKAVDCYIESKNGVSDSELCEYFKAQSEVRYTYTGFGAVHVDVS